MRGVLTGPGLVRALHALWRERGHVDRAPVLCSLFTPFRNVFPTCHIALLYAFSPGICHLKSGCGQLSSSLSVSFLDERSVYREPAYNEAPSKNNPLTTKTRRQEKLRNALLRRKKNNVN